ncbi:unnamed protein product, partial [Iphiclides podalirius]
MKVLLVVCHWSHRDSFVRFECTLGTLLQRLPLFNLTPLTPGHVILWGTGTKKFLRTNLYQYFKRSASLAVCRITIRRLDTVRVRRSQSDARRTPSPKDSSNKRAPQRGYTRARLQHWPGGLGPLAILQCCVWARRIGANDVHRVAAAVAVASPAGAPAPGGGGGEGGAVSARGGATSAAGQPGGERARAGAVRGGRGLAARRSYLPSGSCRAPVCARAAASLTDFETYSVNSSRRCTQSIFNYLGGEV